jgi:hypothetical protein
MIKRFSLLCVMLSILLGCSKITVENPSDKFSPAKKLAKLDNKKLEEVSGGAASINNPDYFWLHNDSGNGPEVFLVDSKLNILYTCTLKDVENRDWEDIAVGPGPEEGKSYIYIGEIGDNDAKYKTKYIYRLEEPKWDGKSATATITSFDTIAFELPDAKKDSETLLLDPSTKDLYVISKRDEPVWLYRIKYPQNTKATTTAERLTSMPFVKIVGGDFSPDGKKILLKNYEHIYYWETDGRKSIADLLKEKPFEIPYELEPQGEAIMWARDNQSFYTISEKNVGKESYLYIYQAKQ